jgi:hypothetical protein
MARPHKLDAERRHNHTVRYTDAEWTTLCERGEGAGLAPSEYAREASLSARVVRVVRKGLCDPALVSEVNRLSLQLSALGNLANQIALYAHTGRTISRDWELLPAEIRQAQRAAVALLESLVGQQRGNKP